MPSRPLCARGFILLLVATLAITVADERRLMGQGRAPRPPEPKTSLVRPPEPKDSLDASWASALRWRSLGPGSMGGRIVDLAVVESDPSTYYVATASGGVFKTTTGGVTFDPIFDKAGSLAVGDMCVAPSDPNVVWVGTGEHNPRNSVSWGDGVYKSIDAGKTFTHMGLRRSFQIGRIVIHPKNPNTVFVGVCGRLWGTSQERGLYRSDGGGKTWKRVLFVDERTGCIDIAFQPGNPGTLLAAMYERQRDAFDVGDPAKRWGPGSGLYRSTDGGATWSRLAKGLPTFKLGRIGIAWSRKNPKTAYAIVESEKIGTAPEGSIRKKGSAYLGISGGASDGSARIFSVLRGGPSDKAGLAKGDLILAADKKPIKDYKALLAMIREHAAGDKVKLKIKRGEKDMSVDLTFGDRPARGGREGRPFGASLGGQQANMQKRQGPKGFQTGGVFRTTDAGESWARVNSLNPRPFYYSQIHVDPTDDRNLFVLGIAQHISEDGGKTFRTTGRGVHSDHHTMWIDPRDSRHIVLGCDGGLYETYDRTKTWDFIQNLPLGQFYHVTVDTKRMYNIYGGLQDNGSWGGPSALRGRIGPTAEDWFPIGGGDGFICLVDPDNPDLVYYESQYGRLARVNIRNGKRASNRPPKIKDKTYRFNWKTPFLLSSHNGRIYYAAGNYVFRSLNRGEQLRIISPEITRTKRGTSTALAESPLDPDVLYVGTDDGALWATRDGGHNWSDVMKTMKGAPGPRRVSSIEASRVKPGRVYVTLDGHYYDDDSAYVMASEDFGATWRNLRANLPAVPARVVREDLAAGNVLYLGTEFGAWMSVDRGENWQPLGGNMPRVAVHELAQHRAAGDLIAGTHGRGIWIMDVTPLRQSSEKSLQASVQLYRPTSAVLWAGWTRKRLFGQKRFVGENPPSGTAIWYRLSQKSKKVSLKILDSTGKDIQRLKAPADVGLHRVVWNLRHARGATARFGTAAASAAYQVVLEVDGKKHSQQLLVTTDPEFPQAPTQLQMEEDEYDARIKHSLELTD